MTYYPYNFRGTNMDGPNASETELLLEGHKAVLKDVVALAFKHWPYSATSRRAMIEGAVTCAILDMQDKLPFSPAMNKKALDEKLRYLDANVDHDQEAVLQCLMSMMAVYEDNIQQEAA